jgi:hypothetical protein
LEDRVASIFRVEEITRTVLDCIPSLLFSFPFFLLERRKEEKTEERENVIEERKRKEKRRVCYRLTFFVSRVISSILRMEAICSSETS